MSGGASTLHVYLELAEPLDSAVVMERFKAAFPELFSLQGISKRAGKIVVFSIPSADPK